MEEKRRLVGTEIDGELPHLPRRTHKPCRRRQYLFVVVTAALFVLALFKALLDRSYNHGACRHARLRSYPGESIKWQDCGRAEDAGQLECSSIEVPMDQFAGDKPGNKTFSIPLIRMRGKNATANLVVNPGGPGGSGVEFVRRAGKRLRTIVGDDLHILSFDPRGIAGSRPAARCYPDQQTRTRRSFALADAPQKDPAGFWAWNRNYVRACADTMGEAGRFINTPQTAADMNSVLDAVGQRAMVYWGFSYGSLLGQTYATLFPERAERVIVDGVVNQFEWYTELLEPHDFADSENVLHGFFAECVKAGPDNCTLAALADGGREASPHGLEDKVMAFLRGLEADPQSVYINGTTYGTLNWNTMLLSALFSSMYKPERWSALADSLAQLLRGNGTAALLAYALRDEQSPSPGLDADQEHVVHINDGVSGPASWPETAPDMVDMLAPLLNRSMFAVGAYDDYFAKAQWAMPTTHGYVPRRGVETRHPLLVLSTTYDPICPLASARTARDAFVGARLVEVKGYGHCSIAVRSTCLADHVRGFLRNGTLPAEDAQCEVDGPYFIKPEHQQMTAAGVPSEDDVGSAQQALADALYGRRAPRLLPHVE
ncbi:hypothetical protein HIM_00514 [Hirsutella minnesotensis 3608]|nr:hypothetical protein HIM_00514 [Hirsutella minnesotensis 3608]